MAKIVQNEVEYFSSKQIRIDKKTESASVITYNNSNSNLKANNVQDAIDGMMNVKEINGKDIYINDSVDGDIVITPIKNLIYYDLDHIKGTNGNVNNWNGNVYTDGDMTITFNEDGTVLLNGTNNTGNYMYVDFFDSRSHLEANDGSLVNNFMNLKRNTVYTLSCKELESQEPGKIYLISNAYDKNGSNANLADAAFFNSTKTENKPVTVLFNPPSNMIDMKLFMHIYPGASFDNLLIRPMLEEGEVAHNWVPPTGYTITSVNKNIYNVQLTKGSVSLEEGSWNEDSTVYTINGLTATFNYDLGTITLDGTLTLYNSKNFSLFPFLRVDTLKRLNMSSNNQYVFMLGADLPENCYLQYSNFEDGSIDVVNNYIILSSLYDEKAYPAQAVCMYIPDGTTFNNVILRPMLMNRKDYDAGNTNFVVNKFKDITVDFTSGKEVYGLESYEGTTNIIDYYNTYKKIVYPVNNIGKTIMSAGESKEKLDTVFNLRKCEEENYIESDTDFNNITKAGQYIVSSNGIAETCTNMPSGNAGQLIVINSIGKDFSSPSHTYILQMYIDFTNNIFSRHIYKANNNNELTYGDWNRFATSTDLDELKKSVSDGKKLLADAITAKGITTASDASFDIMAQNIANL